MTYNRADIISFRRNLEMSELWCDYEARINWLQMYSLPQVIEDTQTVVEVERPDERVKTIKRRKSSEDPLSPRSKRAARCPAQTEAADKPIVMGFIPGHLNHITLTFFADFRYFCSISSSRRESW